VTLVLDAGALIAIDKGDRAMWRRLKSAHLAGDVPLSHGGIIGQAWRGRGPRHALLVRALAGLDVRPLDEALGRAAGELLAAAKRRDVVDAALVLLATDGDHIVTSDPDDLAPLARAAGRHVEIIRA
jgi:hypothetical protein